MSETNWDRCVRLAGEVDKDDLIKRLLMQIAKMRKPRDQSLPLWSFVGAATNHGSGVSCAICYIYGVDSDSGKPKPPPPPTCPICGGTEHVDPLPGTVGRRCVKCCNVKEHG